MDHQTIAQMLGNYGEFFGAIAVIVTLVYLTLQVRQNTSAIRQQGYNDLLGRRNEWFQASVQDRELANLLAKGLNGERFDVIDAQRFTYMMINNMGHFQDCFLQYQAGIIEESVWKAELRIMAPGFMQPGMQSWWEQAKQFFVPQFVTALEQEVEPVDLVLYDPNTSTWFRGKEFPTASD